VPFRVANVSWRRKRSNELPNSRSVYVVMQCCHVLRSAILCSGNTVLYSGGRNLNVFLFADCNGFTHSSQGIFRYSLVSGLDASFPQYVALP